MITIFDYGAGNLRSVENTLAELGCAYALVRDREGLRRADKILLPGVGHFGQMMRALDELDVRAALVERIRAGVPFLGICLGLQALFEASEEAPEARGLGLFAGVVRRFPSDARVPHMGWNELEVKPGFEAGAGFARPAVRVLRAQLLRAGGCTRGGDLHLRRPLHGGARGGQRLRRAIPSREVRAGRIEDCAEFCGDVSEGRSLSGERRGLFMLAKRIIPCLDVTGGRVVKGVNFVNLRDAGDPVELADRYNRDGADELVFLDITASSDAREIMAGVVERTARKVFIPLAVGGGIRSVADARRILMAGADKVSVNTAAVRRPELITELSREFGAQAVVLAIDARRHAPGAMARLHARRSRR